MAKKLFTGSYTTENHEELVIFIIGMRFNNRLAIHKWLPIFTAMPGMIK
jgi:hypothetical protein